MMELRVTFGGSKGRLSAHAEGGGRINVQNIHEMNPDPGEEWIASLIFDEGRGKRRLRTIKLLRRVDAQTYQLPNLGDFWIEKRKLNMVVVFVRAGRTIILRGPSGTGKTTLPYRLAKALGLKHVKVDVGLHGESKDFFGIEGARDGKTLFSESDVARFLRDAEKQSPNGDITHLLHFDELNRVHPRVISSALHGLLDDTREVTVMTSEGPIQYRLPKNVGVLCTMNPNDPRYGGTFALDQAMLDRCVVIDIDYPPKEVEAELIVSRLAISGMSLSMADAIRIVEAASHLRDGAKSGTVNYSPSPRKTMDTAILVASGVPVRQAIEDVLLTPYTGESADAQTERGQAFSLIRAKEVGLAEVTQLRRSS